MEKIHKKTLHPITRTEKKKALREHEKKNKDRKNIRKKQMCKNTKYAYTTIFSSNKNNFAYKHIH